MIHEAAFRNLFHESATREAMARANGRHRLGVLETALAAHFAGSPGTKSDAEDALLALIRKARLPEPLVNVRVDTATRRLEVDFHWPEHRLVVEVDGDGHDRPRTQLDDEQRDELLREAGYLVLRITADAITTNPTEALRTVRTALSPR